MHSLYELAKSCAAPTPPVLIHVVQLAGGGALGEAWREGFRGNYVSLVSVSGGSSRIIGDVLLLRLLLGGNGPRRTHLTSGYI